MVCNYEIKGPESTAKDGEFIYLTLDKLDGVTVSVAIGTAITDIQSVCKPHAGETLIARYPEKFFLSFQATGNLVAKVEL